MLSIIVPAHNEEKNMTSVLDRLIQQNDRDGNRMAVDTYRIIVVVSAKTTDNTEAIVKKYIEREKSVQIYLTQDPGNGFVEARLAGINFILDNEDMNKFTQYIAFCDADLIVPDIWVNTILTSFADDNYDVISFAGTFPLDFWKRVPKLAQKYYDEVGTIFFDKSTIEYYQFDDKCLFTEGLFQRFGRPLSGGCYSIRKSKYLSCGGYIKEYKDENKTDELDGPTWRMMFRLYQQGVRVYYSRENAFECSARRMVADPSEFFSIKQYDKMNELKHYRDIDDKSYDNLENLSDHIDFEPIRMYVIEYYIFLWIINDISLLTNNRDFFGTTYDNIYQDIMNWNDSIKEKTSLKVFDFAKILREKYAEQIISVIS
ncbi:glycosyl transferase family 2 [Paenibacillus curdlanolyticus YK9]|uniref:4,4'-diaponeurosporenoate glycosyltransferase n=1 Tax=Paenibacillus curdlanolyticus YK9 TaxID=717606 RepID=E0I8C3_9BACL|nr:glycosyltransferase [Paenibacillus curdlanolyticus]EFM11428.1 glycosyl transferase family 2 [Paenibacillus curdlanolyticus YK9]